MRKVYLGVGGTVLALGTFVCFRAKQSFGLIDEAVKHVETYLPRVFKLTINDSKFKDLNKDPSLTNIKASIKLMQGHLNRTDWRKDLSKYQVRMIEDRLESILVNYLQKHFEYI